MTELDELIKLAKIVAKPWCICTWILAVLLVISLGVNGYLASREFSVTFGADDNFESGIDQTNNG